MKHGFRKVAVVAAVAFAIGSPAVQAATGWGLSPAEFSAEGDETLRAAGYAFAIWSLIYAGLAAFAVFQFLPRTDGSRAVNRIAWPAALAIAGSGAWIWASAADSDGLTVAVILGSAVAAIAAVVRGLGASSLGERLLAVWPVALLAGWLTVASAINALTSLTDLGYIPQGRRLPAALAGLAVVVAVTVWVLQRARDPVYALPVAWGLVAVFVAERGDSPIAGWTALAAAALVLLYAGATARKTTSARR
jgi:hypothetical protein